MPFVGELKPIVHQQSGGVSAAQAMQVHGQERNVIQDIRDPVLVGEREAVDELDVVVFDKHVLASQVTVTRSHPPSRLALGEQLLSSVDESSGQSCNQVDLWCRSDDVAVSSNDVEVVLPVASKRIC